MRKATGSYRTYSVPGKTAALVPELAVEDLPSAELQPRFLPCNEGPVVGLNTLMMKMMMCTYFSVIYFSRVFRTICKFNVFERKV